MRCKVLEDRSDRIYVPLRAILNPRVSNKMFLPLMSTVLEFLESELRVFLLLGDSGSGKSTFCRQLLRTLWSNYTQGCRIPLFVDLRDIDRPSDHLIESQLQEHDFSDADVRELLQQRRFVLVCDGYDESRLSTSIYTKRLGQLDVKMIVSCRNAFLGRNYQGRFYPLGHDNYNDDCAELFEEAIITPFQESDIQNFIKQYALNFAAQEPSDRLSVQHYKDYWEKITAIPNLMDLASNPFLLTLALKALPSLSIDLQDLANNKATRLQLYDRFVKEWIRINIARLQRSKLSQEYRSVFDSLLNDGFEWCVKDFSKRLAEAMHEHQRGHLVVKFSCRHNEPWKVEFFGQEINSVLLRESSLLSRAGFRHWFIHKSLFDYFRSLVLYDPDESDSDDPDDDWGDPHGGRGPHGDGGNSFIDGGDGLFGYDGGFDGGDGSLSGESAVLTSNSGGSAGGGSGGPTDSSSGSTGGSSDSSGGNSGSSGSNSGSADSNSGSPCGNSASKGGNDDSGGKDGPSGNGDSSHQSKDSYRSRRKASKNKSSPCIPTDYLRPGSVHEHTAGTGATGRMLMTILSDLQNSPRRATPPIQQWYHPPRIERPLSEHPPLSSSLPSRNEDQIDPLEMQRIAALNRKRSFTNKGAENEHLDLPERNLEYFIARGPDDRGYSQSESHRMAVLPPGDLPTPTSSSKFLSAARRVHHKANSSITTDVNFSELDHDNGSEKGYNTDSRFVSEVSRKARLLGKSKSKKIPHALPLGLPVDVPAPVIAIHAPELIEATIAWESGTVELFQPEGGIPPQPPISNPTDSRDTDQISPLPTSDLRYDIFIADAPKPTVRSPTPKDPRARMESTLQLVLCARLLLEEHHLSTSQNSPTGVCVIDDAERHWLDSIQEDLSAQARIRWWVSRLVAEFLKDPSPGPEVIFEVVILGPVICQSDYRALLSCFIERFDQSALLNVDLLQGMIQLLQSAPSGFLTDDDLVHTVRSLRKRLESTHAPNRAHVYQLVFAVSKVLEVMVRGEFKGLNRQRDHQSLLAALRNLKGVDGDDFLKFQVNYAYQMSLYLPDDETFFQAFWRYAESVAVGVSAVASDFKLDPMSALAAVEHIQQGAGNAIDVVKFSIDGARAFQATADGATQAAERAFCSQKKQAWFLALQAGYLFVQDGRLVDFNILVSDATHRLDVNFQRGVCQILGEVALNPLWDNRSRRSAIDFLGELCKTDAGRRKDVKVRKWVATILQQISSSALPDVSGHARTLLEDLQQEHAVDVTGCGALRTVLPLPTVFPLLERALDITDIDHEVARIRFQSLEECLHPVSIPLRAKATLLAPEDESFPLMAKVQEFLRSDNLVFLLLGDSGSGKSTFCRQLERELWNRHQQSGDGRIPLYISLPSIDDPHCDLIEKYLQHHHDILEPTSRKMKHHRQFVLICDGYDESRLIQNLHTSNRLNRPGQWNVKMIITCRSAFLGPDYQCRFYPLGDDIYHDKTSGFFQEATIVPFQKSDIQEFVRQYVLDFTTQEPSNNPSAPSFDDYWEKLSVIPNVMNLVSNPFLLTLALKAIPSIEALDSSGLEVMQQDLYHGFIQEWVWLHQKRLQGTILKRDIRAAFDVLLRDGFAWCVTDYLKRLADAIYQHQDGRPVVEFSQRHMDEWKLEFFGPEIKTTLLRDATPLTRAGIRHWFIHKSLLDYFYALTFYDPDDADDDDSEDGEDSDDDSRDDVNDFQRGGGNALGDAGYGLIDDNGDSAGGNRGSTGGNTESAGNNGGSSGGNGGSSGGNGGSTGDNQDLSGGINNFSGGSSGSSSGGNNDASRGDKNGFNGEEDGFSRRKDGARSKRKGNSNESRASTSSDPFSKRNLFKEPSVLQFLVERAKSDPRLKKRLFSVIEPFKASSVPSLAAANAITILFKSGNRFQDANLEGVPIPSDYMSIATESTVPAQCSVSNLTGEDLMKVLMTPTIPASAPTVPAPIPFSTTIAQKTPTASLRHPRSGDKNRPLWMPRMLTMASSATPSAAQSRSSVGGVVRQASFGAKGGQENIWLSAKKGNLALVKYLLGKEPSLINTSWKFDGSAVLSSACASRQPQELVEYLVQRGAQINSADTFYKRTALHILCEEGGHRQDDWALVAVSQADQDANDQDVLAAMRFLLDRGAAVEAKNHWKETPLMRLLAGRDCPLMVQELYSRGADSRLKSSKDVYPYGTALCYAAYYGRIKSLKWIIENDLLLNDEASIKVAICWAKGSKSSDTQIHHHSQATAMQSANIARRKEERKAEAIRLLEGWLGETGAFRRKELAKEVCAQQSEGWWQRMSGIVDVGSPTSEVVEAEDVETTSSSSPAGSSKMPTEMVPLWREVHSLSESLVQGAVPSSPSNRMKWNPLTMLRK
ncbi:MAG: hypothetical protein JOS17DRAFT_827104 [Linnemannia elongata]|nr:MAG: hypothetical protein JOS17DRAFT_827104 [Linnemannia elongata]